MLKFRYRRITGPDDDTPMSASMTETNPDLRIRNLLDDPALQRAMETDVDVDVDVDLDPVFARTRPARPFNQRKLLEQAAA